MATNEELRRQLAESHRSGRRQAAPFSKGKRSSKPKRPGRKPGMGLFSYRKPPSDEEITGPVVEVPVSEDTCPGCGGSLVDEGESIAYVTDIPPVRRPQVRAYRVQVCRRRSCGKAVRGQHPDIGSDQHGASAHRLQNELGWHDDRDSLLRFLDDPSIEPTNNRAERALRPAVIARKVSHCSKTVEGADAFSAFTSVIRTLERNGDDQSVVDRLCALFSGPPLNSPSRRTSPAIR